MAVRAEKCVHADCVSINQARSVASAEDAKLRRIGHGDPGQVVRGTAPSRAARNWRLTTGMHAVNLVLQILETR